MVEAVELNAQPVYVERKPNRLRRFGLELLQTFVLMALLFLGIRGIVQNFRVEGPSMQPTLSSGQYLWVNKAAYLELNGQFMLGGPQRGDIAVVRPPNENVDLIKRVIGLPGDRVLIKNGEVFINGQPLEEPYIRFSAGYSYPIDGQPLIVPQGQYFVLGDNRSNSRDSHLGWFVSADSMIGRAWLTYWPPASWGVMPAVAYAVDR
jgi:signal peptidase I